MVTESHLPFVHTYDGSHDLSGAEIEQTAPWLIDFWNEKLRRQGGGKANNASRTRLFIQFFVENLFDRAANSLRR